MIGRRLLARLRGDRRGTAAEFALVLPIWLMLTFLVFNVGRFWWARAGILHGLGEAARTATLFPRRTNAEITAAFNDRVFGLTSGAAPTVTITTGTASSQTFVDIRVTYSPDFWLVGIPVSPITFTYTRRAFRPT